MLGSRFHRTSLNNADNFADRATAILGYLQPSSCAVARPSGYDFAGLVEHNGCVTPDVLCSTVPSGNYLNGILDCVGDCSRGNANTISRDSLIYSMFCEACYLTCGGINNLLLNSICPRLCADSLNFLRCSCSSCLPRSKGSSREI
jgi:hypothetical protein